MADLESRRVLLVARDANVLDAQSMLLGEHGIHAEKTDGHAAAEMIRVFAPQIASGSMESASLGFTRCSAPALRMASPSLVFSQSQSATPDPLPA